MIRFLEPIRQNYLNFSFFQHALTILAQNRDCMAKWANYLIIGAVISMIIPFILDYLDLLHNHVFWPMLSIVSVSLGISIHTVNGVQKQKLNLPTLLILLSVLVIVMGFSFVQLNVNNSEYLLLLGMLIVLVWLFLPNSKKK